MRLRSIVDLLRGVDDFVGVASVVVENATKLFDLHHCAVTLLSAAARPSLLVDNDPDLTDALRQRYVAGELTADPMCRALAETRAPAAGHDPVECSYRGINVVGMLGVTAILEIRLATDGKFLGGKLHSIRQRPPGGPSLDPDGAAVRAVRELSAADFAATTPSIADNGARDENAGCNRSDVGVGTLLKSFRVPSMLWFPFAPIAAGRSAGAVA